jgi:ElaB/YqjD/DUF883 family membrane-anchored ribosome-binding protein
MTSDPDQIRADIELTRARLSDDVNNLSDSVNPKNVARRQADKARGALGSVKDRVMGTAGDVGSRVKDTASGVTSKVGDTVSGVGDSASNAGSSAGSALSSAGSAVTSTPDTVKSQAAGNPLAAGLIAFGVGWLAGSLLPASQAERQTAVKAKETVVPMAGDAAKEIGQNLKQPAQEAAQSVQQAAADAASTVKQEGQSATSDLKDQASDAKDSIQQSRS